MTRISNGFTSLHANTVASNYDITHYLLHDTFLLRLFFDPEDGGDMFPRNVC
jgi:hypothetical protein